MRVYFWGTGSGCRKALTNYKYKEEIAGFIDNNPAQWGKTVYGRRVFRFGQIREQCDFIVITVVKYEAVKFQLEQEGFGMDKVLCYFDPASGRESEGQFFDEKGWKTDILEMRLGELERIVDIRIRNMGYEAADRLQKGKYWFPVIHGSEEAVERIVNEKCSMIRFGDGEFEIMAGRERLPYQDCEESLSVRLREVIETEKENILIGIADNYGDIDIYSDEVADGIREYMTEEVRAFHMSVLKPDRVYYNAYMFKCYFPFKDKTRTQERVNLIKKIWYQRDVVLVEGCETRTGQGNDLLDNARSVQRILCPAKNAFSSYGKILGEVKKVSKESLILCVLGPAAKVLAYDLIQCGYQVVDIGQIDMDYEWFRAGKGKRVPVRGKYVSQLPPAEVEDVEDEGYARQVIARIV